MGLSEVYGRRGLEGEIAMARRYHQASWDLLLLPIILTSAFVIFGAWRSASRARNAKAEIANEDE